MKRKNVLSLSILSVILASSVGIQSASAGTTTLDDDKWSYSDYSNGSYVPRGGTLTLRAHDGASGNPYFLDTTVRFDLDSTNVDSIHSYNMGTKACGNAGKVYAYLTIDVTAIGDGVDLEIGANTITSDLPNFKPDIDSVSNGSWDNNESEVTVLGRVEVDERYSMRTFWDDFRDGDAQDSGKIQAQFSMSNEGLTEYNNCTQSTAIQGTVTYGDDYNQ
ncbi:hypothetical protein [Brevibacillus fortis]|uniref:hypothetical protein n=1 Tax=Brevibacillus fortis TaxID=2126352 RepID=UPI0038FC9E1F